jgi:SAM-dependent methyltransferase
MTTNDYATRMAAVYGHIYQDRYNLHPNELGDARDLLSKNIAEFGLAPNAIRGWTMFNTGTGREAVAAIDLGARACHIADISPLTMDRIRFLQASREGYENIVPYCADICDPAFTVPAKIDFVYLNGVFHHLYDPWRAAANIHGFLDEGGYLYMRLYRSGSLRFFIADFVRRFMRYEDSPVAEQAFVDKFGPFAKDQGLKNEDAKVHLYEMSFNDMFVPVPVLNLFDPVKLYSFFERNGYTGINKPAIRPYDHEVKTKGGTAYSAYFRKVRNTEFKEDSLSELANTDQLDGIAYQEDYIKETVRLMKAALSGLKTKSSKERCALCFDLFYAAQINRLAHFYNKTELGFDKLDVASLDNAAAIHNRLHGLLLPYV